MIYNFSLPQGKFGVLICFEIIFPDLCRRFVKGGANFLVTITNDAWFGRTSAPYQHFTIAVFRAIENRVFIARAANTGITGFIDPRGKIIKKGEIFAEEAMSETIHLSKKEDFLHPIRRCLRMGLHCLLHYPIVRIHFISKR